MLSAVRDGERRTQEQGSGGSRWRERRDAKLDVALLSLKPPNSYKNDVHNSASSRHVGEEGA